MQLMVVRLSQVSSYFHGEGLFVFGMRRFYKESELIFADFPTVWNFKNLSGQKFGILSVIGFNKGKRAGEWFCKCECGNIISIVGCDLISGRTSSCGCSYFKKLRNGELALRHGHARHGNVSKVYSTWSSMKARCYNEDVHNYFNYGGRGIKVCDRWLKSFENFLADMGDKPNGFTIERINSDGNYEPGNCRWATVREQNNNRRNSSIINHDGRSQTVAQWAREIGVNEYTIHCRLKRGWDGSKALTTPIRKMNFKNK